MEKRKIKIGWLERVLDNPDKQETDKFDSELEHCLAVIPEFGNRILRIIVKKETNPTFVITAFFDRRLKRKN
ncbi:MAG: DUF4258 domain-containing protein [Calditrichaeota bacterium]|nr:DUF4258 domain-containing protein [Calditrichota bacterium]MBT7617618.1 DUF4258 domain-containing protein [Calditrichota bacterium]